VSELDRFLSSVTSDSPCPDNDTAARRGFLLFVSVSGCLRDDAPREGTVRNASCEERRLFRLPESSQSTVWELVFRFPELFNVSLNTRTPRRSDVGAGSVFARKSNDSDFLLFP